MKKKFAALLVFLAAAPLASQCPKGKTECSSPCGRFIDLNNDGTCDKIQPETFPSAAEKAEIRDANPPRTNPEKAEEAPGEENEPYHPGLIPLILSILYFSSHIAAKKKILSPVFHFRLWNFLLLISFTVSCGLGILLAGIPAYGWKISFPFNPLYWHVETGIAMTAIGLFHVHWHWKYIKGIFKIR